MASVNPPTSPWSATRRDVDVAALVAKYAPLGKRRRRLHKLQRAGLLLLIPVGLALAYGVVQTGWLDRSPPPTNAAGQTRTQETQVQELQARLQAAAGAIGVERQHWDEQRKQLEAQNAALLAKLSTLEARWQVLDDQRRSVEVQRLALESRREPSSAADTNGERSQPRGSSIRTEIVNRELRALSAQRSDLEQQQHALETQRQELQALMQRYDEAARAGSKPAASEQPPVGPTPATGARVRTDSQNADVLPEPQLMAANQVVGDETLGNMRGGLRLGDGPEISFGLTRTGSVNGVEQFSNSVFVDNLGRISGGVTDGTAGQTLLIQNGIGNIVAAGSLPTNFGTIIQNTLDAQLIQTKTVIDITVGNVSGMLNSIGANRAITESLSFQHP